MWSESFNIHTPCRLHRTESNRLKETTTANGIARNKQVGDDPKHNHLVDARESFRHDSSLKFEPRDRLLTSEHPVGKETSQNGVKTKAELVY